MPQEAEAQVCGPDNWCQQVSPTTNLLTSVANSGDTAWAAGWSGTILHSTDGGINWVVENSGTTEQAR